MSTYATPALMIVRFTPTEIMQRTDDTGLLTAEIMKKAVAGADLSAYTLAQQAAAADSVTRLQRACDDADGAVIIRLTTGGYSAPLSGGVDFVSNLACDIARYYLYDNVELKDTDVISRRYRDATKNLELFAAGKYKFDATSEPAVSFQSSDEVLAVRDRSFTC